MYLQRNKFQIQNDRGHTIEDHSNKNMKGPTYLWSASIVLLLNMYISVRWIIYLYNQKNQ